MIPHVIVLEPGFVIYKIYNGYWFFGRPLWKISARTYVPLPRNAGRTGSSRHLNSARNFSIRTTRRTSKLSVNRIRSGIAIGYTLRRDRPGLIPGAKLFVM
jgi:hypothetical protein